MQRSPCHIAAEARHSPTRFANLLQASPAAESSDPLEQFAQRIIGMTSAALSKGGIQSLEHSVCFWPRESSQ